jgi:hypothetical protein
MARRNVTAEPPAGLNHRALAAGLGKLKGPGGDRLVGPDGSTLAYLKKHVVTVPAALVAKAPKKLGTFTAEANGHWAGVKVADNTAAREVLEYVASAHQQKEKR